MSEHGTLPPNNPPSRHPSTLEGLPRAIRDWMGTGMAQLSREIASEARRTRLPGVVNGPQDVYRHCILAGELRLRYGRDAASTILNANEVDGYVRGITGGGLQTRYEVAAQTKMDKLVNDRCLAAMRHAETPEDVRRIAHNLTRQALAHGGTGRNGTLPYRDRRTWTGSDTAIPDEFGGEDPENAHPGFAPVAVEDILRRDTETWTEADRRAVIADPRYHDPKKRDPAIVARVTRSYELAYPSTGPGGSPIEVDAYSRADGTQVDAHTRRAPSR
jgi:hypothetical protein